MVNNRISRINRQTEQSGRTFDAATDAASKEALGGGGDDGSVPDDDDGGAVLLQWSWEDEMAMEGDGRELHGRCLSVRPSVKSVVTSLFPNK